jgi:lipopolysaccharide biosynthesis regulator YciM
MEEMEKNEEVREFDGERKSSKEKDAEITMEKFPPMFKKALREAVASGKLSLALGNVSGSLEATKSAVESMAQVVEKAREILSSAGKKDGIGSAAVLSSAWLPMVLGLMKTSEFQNLTASMIANMLKEK